MYSEDKSNLDQERRKIIVFVKEKKKKKGICQDPVKKEKEKGGEASQDLKERHPSSHQ